MNVDDDRPGTEPGTWPVTMELAARRTAAAAVLGDYKAALASAPMTRPPGHEWMFRLADALAMILEALSDVDSSAAAEPRAAAGPFETEREARAVAHAAVPPSGGSSILSAAGNRKLLGRAIEAAGVRTGRYDDRIIEWLSDWEDSTCAVIAGLITRACQAGRVVAEDTRRIDAIRALLARFDWEHHDRQLALEAIDRIVDPRWDGAV